MMGTIDQALAEIARLRAALETIAKHGEGLWRDYGEPQNGVPEFCRAILAGRDVRLGGE